MTAVALATVASAGAPAWSATPGSTDPACAYALYRAALSLHRTCDPGNTAVADALAAEVERRAAQVSARDPAAAREAIRAAGEAEKDRARAVRQHGIAFVCGHARTLIDDLAAGDGLPMHCPPTHASQP